LRTMTFLWVEGMNSASGFPASAKGLSLVRPEAGRRTADTVTIFALFAWKLAESALAVAKI